MTEKIDLTETSCASLAKIAQGSKQNFQKKQDVRLHNSRITAYRSQEIYEGRFYFVQLND